jgi:hypothetical protein
MQVKLTAGFVATAGAPSDGKDRIIYWDEKRPGFGLMVTPAGKRSFVFQYRNGQGDSRRASLSGTTKLPDAHKWADILQGDIAKGVDPVEKKKADRTAQSKKGKFRTIAEEAGALEGAFDGSARGHPRSARLSGHRRQGRSQVEAQRHRGAKEIELKAPSTSMPRRSLILPSCNTLIRSISVRFTAITVIGLPN